MRERRSVVLVLSILAVTVSADEQGWVTKPWNVFNQPSPVEGLSQFDRDFHGVEFGFNGPQNVAAGSQYNSQVLANPYAPKLYPKSYPPKKYQHLNKANTGPQTFQPNYSKPKPVVRLNKPGFNPGFPQPHGKSLHFGPHTNNRPLHAGKFIKHKYNMPIKIFENANRPEYHYVPVSSQFQVFHPYQLTNPQINQYHNDPVYGNIKHAVDENGLRVQHVDEPRPPREDDEESLGDEDEDEEVEVKHHRNEQNENFQPQFEIHHHQNVAHYYRRPNRLPINYARINRKNKYPRLNYQHIKVRPQAFNPLRNHISALRVTQGKTFGDENDNYPALKPAEEEDNVKAPDGYDIYENQRNNFDNENANFKSNFNHHNQKHHPESVVHHNDDAESGRSNDSDDDDDRFVPIRMYAQVRHTETTKHLPREAALDDAETYSDVLNAPRLKQAIKTSKAQTVYSEEGYEDNAYDHAGHLKHASNHEGHGGYIKSKEAAAGRYKGGDESQYNDGGRSAHGQSVQKGKKWRDDRGDNEEFENQESFDANEREHESDTDDQDEAGSDKKGKKTPFAPKSVPSYKGGTNKLVMTTDEKQTMVKDTNDGVMVNTKSKYVSMNNEPDNISKPKYIRLRPNYYWKRIKKNNTNTNTKQDTVNKNDTSSPKNKTDIKAAIKEKFPINHKRSRRSTKFELPVLSFDEAFLTDKEIDAISKQKLGKIKQDDRHKKYPYYNRFHNSPLRYAEDLNNIPAKTRGGSEFYDSRAAKECAEVEPQVDPVPERIKNKQPDDEEEGDDDGEDNDDDNNDDNNNEDEKENSDRRKRQIKIKILKRKRRDNFDENKKPRLNGLGDQIDCFKEKYFGADPLDSPFFQEDVIESPKPIHTPHNLALIQKRLKNLVPFGSIRNEKITALTPPKRPTIRLPPPINPIIKNHNNIDVNVAATTYKPEYRIYRTTKPELPAQVNNTTELLTGEMKPIKRSPVKPNIKFVPGIHGTQKIISIPNDIFKKYTLSRDPQAKVYGDVIGNIRANLNAEMKKRLTGETTYTPAYIPINYESNPNGGAEFKKLPKMIYYAYKNKEDIHNPNNHVRITRNNHFIYEPYKIIKESQLQTKRPSNTHNLRPKLKNKKRLNIVAQASSDFETIVDINGQPVKRNINNKLYKNIGKRERTAANDSDVLGSEDTTVSDGPVYLGDKIDTEEEDTGDGEDDDDDYDPRVGEASNENGEVTYHKNHKKYYSPVTSKTSISPEELKVEYILKSTEDADHELDESQRSQNSTDTVDDASDGKSSKPSKVILKNSRNRSKDLFDRLHRFRGHNDSRLNVSSTIFDVSSFLPRPIYLTSYLPRHNYSSKYTHAEKVARETDRILAIPIVSDESNIQEVVTDNDENITEALPKSTLRTERIRHTMETFGSTTQVPTGRSLDRKSSTTTESIVNIRRKTDRDLIDSEIKKSSVQPRKIRKRNRIRLATTTTSAPTTEPIYYTEEISTTSATTRRPARTRTPKSRTYQSTTESRKYQTIPRDHTVNHETRNEDDVKINHENYTDTKKSYDIEDGSVPQESDDQNDDEGTDESEKENTSIRPDSSNASERPDYSEEYNTKKEEEEGDSDHQKNDDEWSEDTEKYVAPEISRKSDTTVYEKPKKIKYSRSQSVRTHPQYEKSDDSDDYETVSHKPRILEKTSKKRKTTVITNSKRYNNNAALEPVQRRRNKKTNNQSKQSKTEPSLKYTISVKKNEPIVKETTSKQPEYSNYDDTIDRSDDDPEDDDGVSDNKSENLRRTPLNEESRFEEDVVEEEVIHERQSPLSYSDKQFGFATDPELPKQVNRLSDIKKDDQFPVHSDVEIFKADFKINRGAKHGGNYKKIPGNKKTRKRLDEAGELDDLNVGADTSDSSLHGGNYRTERDSSQQMDPMISAHVLNSFASILQVSSTTEKPYEKNPGKRLYYFANI